MSQGSLNMSQLMSEFDKSLVKAATQNKLGYQNVRSALLSLHEDRGMRRF